MLSNAKRKQHRGKRVQYSYGKVDIGMSVYLDGIAVAGGMAEIKEGTQNVKGLQR